MNANEIDRLLQLALTKESSERSDRCLSRRSILDIVEQAADLPDEDMEHFSECPYCQRQAALVSRNRKIINAPIEGLVCAAGLSGQRRAAKHGTIRI